MNATATGARRPRVAALPADDRRAAIIEATLPLLREYGARVTTRQIADAAGVAEGTIFGVFPDKQSLLRACVMTALDPTPLAEPLWKLSRVPDLRERLIRLVELIAPRMEERGAVLSLIRTAPALFSEPDGPMLELMAAQQMIVTAIAAAIEPDQDQLRRSPLVVARILLSLLFGWGHAPTGEPIDPAELVSLLLDGVLVRQRANSGRGGEQL